MLYVCLLLLSPFSSVSLKLEANHSLFFFSAASKLRWTLCVLSTSEKIFLYQTVGLPKKMELLCALPRYQHTNTVRMSDFTFLNILMRCTVAVEITLIFHYNYFFFKEKRCPQIQTIHTSLLWVWFMGWMPRWMFDVWINCFYCEIKKEITDSCWFRSVFIFSLGLLNRRITAIILCSIAPPSGIILVKPLVSRDSWGDNCRLTIITRSHFKVINKYN